MQYKFNLLSDIISQRRTIKPQQMNAAKIDRETINQLLQLADWAPTHGRTEPWRFFVFADEKVNEFCTAHAQMHRLAHPEKSTDDTFNKLSPGEAMELTNDHDPKPLHYQLLAEYEGKFEWTYLEQGPEIWRIAIDKK